MRLATVSFTTLAAAALFLPSLAAAQNSNFHNAPDSAKQMKNPYEAQPPEAGRSLYHLRCARCHGENGEGSGNIPPLVEDKIKAATPGELFWFITKGDVQQWHALLGKPAQKQRWQIVNYVPRRLDTPAAAQDRGNTGSAHKSCASERSAAHATVHRLPV